MKIKTIEEVPIFTTNLRILKFYSFLLNHNWRRYVSIITYSMLSTGLFLEVFFGTETVDVRTRNAYIAVLLSNVVMRGITLCWNRFEYEHFMDTIRLQYIELMESDDINIRHLLQEMATTSTLVSKINLIMGTLSVMGFVTYPIFVNARVLPCDVHIPGIDKYQSPYYEILFAFQGIVSPIGCCIYIPFTNLVVAFTLFSILMCKVMQYKLSNLKDVSNKKAMEVVLWCIKYQLELIRNVNNINNLITNVNMIEFLTFGAMLCAMLFSMVIAETFAQKIIISTYMFMIFSQSVVLYYFATVLYDQSLNVAVAAYDCNWFDFDVATQKAVKLLILRSQKPCALLVGNVFPMNLELLQSLLNATYSYFTLLKRVYG